MYRVMWKSDLMDHFTTMKEADQYVKACFLVDHDGDEAKAEEAQAEAYEGGNTWGDYRIEKVDDEDCA